MFLTLDFKKIQEKKISTKNISFFSLNNMLSKTSEAHSLPNQNNKYLLNISP